MKTAIPIPKLKSGPVTLVLLTLGALAFLAGIWTRDDRWIQTGTLFVFPGTIAGIIWLYITLAPPPR